jgi:hypothetical protein
VVDQQTIVLQINLQGVDLQQYDALEVWRSRDLPSGPFEELTSNGMSAARLPLDAPDRPAAPLAGPYINASGHKLELLVGSTTVTITITGTDPLTYQQLVTQIGAQGQGLVTAYVVGAQLVLETQELGGHARLEVTGGDLAGQVGLPLATPSFGKEGYLSILNGSLQYEFVDQQGSPSYFYKVRLRNRLLNQVSEFSDVMTPLTTPQVTDTVIGFVDLTDMDGSALEAREVRLYSRFNGMLSNGRVVAGYSKNGFTDKHGHIEFSLVRGLPITVGIAGTNIARDVVVPVDTAITTFNLLDPAFGSNDVFKVQVPNIPYAVRRSS